MNSCLLDSLVCIGHWAWVYSRYLSAFVSPTLWWNKVVPYNKVLNKTKHCCLSLESLRGQRSKSSSATAWHPESFVPVHWGVPHRAHKETMMFLINYLLIYKQSFIMTTALMSSDELLAIYYPSVQSRNKWLLVGHFLVGPVLQHRPCTGDKQCVDVATIFARLFP